jgi:hypothetical protein
LDGIVAQRYPRLTAYVGGLPAGLASYPECLIKASLPLMLLEGMPSPRPDPSDLPDPARRYLLGRPSRLWVPEVEAMAISLIVADQYQMSDAQYLAWLRTQNLSFLNSLMYRAVMSFMSPAHVVPKAAARWAAVHRGSDLTVTFVGARDVDMVLTFPPRLFAPILLEHFTAVFEAVLERSNARVGEVVLAEASDTRGVYHARWE